MQIILASSSVSREKILTNLRLSFKVIPSNIDEEEIKKKVKNIPQIVKLLALKKAEKVEKVVKKKGLKDYLIIGADSLAAIKTGNGKWQYLDKPKSKNQAREMLLISKGKSHKFYSGLAVIRSSDIKKVVFGESTVYFRNFSKKTLERFLDSGVWRGRAGGYDIEDKESGLIEKYEGSYTNILGLPVENLKEVLKEFGIRIEI